MESEYLNDLDFSEIDKRNMINGIHNNTMSYEEKKKELDMLRSKGVKISKLREDKILEKYKKNN